MPILLTDADIAGMLRRVYNAFDNEVFPLLTPLLSMIEKATPKSKHNIKWGGDGAFFPVTLGRPTGFTSSPNGFFAPGNVAALERQASLGVERLYVTREMDNLAIIGTQSKEAAFRPLARKVMAEAKAAVKLGFQEILHGDTRAIKGTITVVGSTTSITVQNPYGITGAGQGGLWLDRQMFVAILPAGGGTPRTGSPVFITNVANTGDAAVLTLASAVTGMNVGDEVVLAATATENSRGRNPNGLTNMLARGGAAIYNTLHNIDRTVAGNSRWDANRLVAGTDFPELVAQEMHIWQLIRVIAGRSGFDAALEASDFLLIGTPGIQRQIAENLMGLRQLGDGDTLKGGFKTVKVCGLNFIADPDCPAGTVYLIHLPSLFQINAKDFGQVSYEGAGPWRFIPGRDAYQTTWGWIGNFGTTNRVAHGMITGYDDTVRYTRVI